MALTLLAMFLLAGCHTPYANEPIYMPLTDASLRGVSGGTASAGDASRSAPSSAGNPSAPLTLDECIAAALATSRRIIMADRRGRIARDGMNEAWGTIAPSLSASVTAETRNNQPGSIFNGNVNEFGNQSTAYGNVSLLVPVYDFGVSSNLRDVIGSQIEQADEAARLMRQEIRFAVTQAYFRVLEAQRIVQVVDESTDVVERQLQIAKDFFEQQLVARNDVLAAQAQLATRQQERLQAEQNRQLALAQLNRLMGRNVNALTRLQDIDATATATAGPADADFVELVLLALQSRPDVQISEEQIAIARSQYQSTRSTFFPQFYLWGRFNFTTDDTQSKQEWLTVGATLNVPIFNLDKFFRLDRNEREIAQAVDSHNDLLDDLVLQVKEAWLAVQTSAQQVPVARLGVELADENLRIERDQYREGLRTSADVLIAEQRLASARSTYFQAVYGQHIARARLANVVGVDRLPEE